MSSWDQARAMAGSHPAAGTDPHAYAAAAYQAEQGRVGAFPLLLPLVPLAAKGGLAAWKAIQQRRARRRALEAQQARTIPAARPPGGTMYAVNPWAPAAVAGWGPQPMFYPPAVSGYDDREDEDDYVLGLIEDEIDALDGEIEAADWQDEATGDNVLGRMGAGLSARIARIEAKIARVEDKAARARRPGKQRRLEKKAARLRAKVERLRAKLTRKLEKKVAKGKISPAAAAAIAAGAGASAGAIGATMMTPTTAGAAPGITAPATGSGMQAYSMLDYPAAPFSGRVPPTSIVNQSQRSPSAGEEVRLPLLVAGSQVSLVTVVAGAGLRTTTFVAESRLIPYAAFQVTGLDVIVNGQPNADALVNTLVSFYGVAGDKNLLYDTQNVSFAGQTKGGPDSTSRRTIGGLRENQILQPTNTISATVTVRQEITNAADVNLTVELAMVGRSIYDPAVRR